MNDSRAVWVAGIPDRAALVRLIRAALARGVAPVDIDATHLDPGPHTLQVVLHGEPIVRLAAELAGKTASGSFALRLAPLDHSQIAELTRLAEDDEPPTTSDDDLDDDDLDASVLFDPEAALISRAPPRPEGTSSEDTLTVPGRTSMVPPSAAPPSRPNPPKRPPSGPHTISHLSFPPLVPPMEPEDLRSTREMVSPSSMDPASTPPDSHPAQERDFSVVFGTEATTPGGPPAAQSIRRDALGVVVSPREGLLIHTPTMPFVMPSRPPPPRWDPAAPVDEDTETYPRGPGRQLAPTSSSTSSRGPRTMRRIGDRGIVGVGRVIANRYRIESLVGTGAVGAVYRASHLELPRTFAIKVLHPHYRADPELVASFRTEAHAASLLDHPNVTVVHDFGEEPDGLVYIVMEYLPGANLQAALDQRRRLEPRRAIEIMLQVCAALAAAHERGIIHRDVKPDNIMLVPARDDEGRPFELVKVCDFGVATLEAAPPTSAEWTAGTPEYMAPEQAYGRYDARTDVYACGIVLYEMLTGRPPFLGDSPTAILRQHANEPPRPPSALAPGLPPALEAVILCAIEKAPARRFSSMRELRGALKRALP